MIGGKNSGGLHFEIWIIEGNRKVMADLISYKVHCWPATPIFFNVVLFEKATTTITQ